MLEELSPFEEPSALLAVPNNDVKPVESYIQDTLNKAFDDVLMFAPLHLVRTTVSTPNSISITVDDGVGYMNQPTDYLRLHTMLVKGWSRPVKAAISSEHPNYLLQRDSYTRGGCVKPVVAVNDSTIELYSVPDNPEVEVFKYIPRTTHTAIQGTNPTQYTDDTFEDTLVEFLIYQDAINILRIFEQFDKAKTLEKKLEELVTQHAI